MMLCFIIVDHVIKTVSTNFLRFFRISQRLYLSDGGSLMNRKVKSAHVVEILVGRKNWPFSRLTVAKLHDQRWWRKTNYCILQNLHWTAHWKLNIFNASYWRLRTIVQLTVFTSYFRILEPTQWTINKSWGVASGLRSGRVRLHQRSDSPGPGP